VQHSNDWFLPAIFTDGPVSSCLGTVAAGLDKQRNFVLLLKSRLEHPERSDSVTDLSHRLKPLENTLRARLPMLMPDRAGAWFRVPAARTSGPFATSVLHEPVFAPYGSAPPGHVRDGLTNAWRTHSASVGVFRVGIRCLWTSLLELNMRYHAINSLSPDYPDLQLDQLPAVLPVELDCKSLRAFLTKVSHEMLSCRNRLDSCYRELMAASQLFFDHQTKADGKSAHGAWRGKAGEFREEQSRRRNASFGNADFGQTGSSTAGGHGVNGASFKAGATIKTAKDIEALRYFGYKDFPDASELRRKYLELAKAYHPDTVSGHEEKFKTLSRVYQHLLQRCLG
jgi:hypothetical protein